MVRSIRASLCFAVLTQLIAFLPAQAFEIDEITLLWLQDRYHDVPQGPNSYGIEAEVVLSDFSGLGSIRLQGPGTGLPQTLTQLNPWQWDLSDSFANGTDLFNAYGQTGTYTFEFLDGGSTVLDSYSITLGGGDINEVTDYLAIDTPTPFGNLPVNGSIDWTCTACDGTSAELDIENASPPFNEVDAYAGAPASGSWSPSGLVAGESYFGEAILADYFENDAPLESSVGGKSFQALVGYESINNFDFSAVPAPEPGTGTLLGGGLIALALRRRGGSRRQR